MESKLSACLRLAGDGTVSDGQRLCVLCLERLRLLSLGISGRLGLVLGRIWGQAGGGSPGLSLLAEATPLFYFDESP